MIATHVQACGVALLLLAVVNVGLPFRYDWKRTLAPLDLLHRQIFKSHALFIDVLLVLLGVLCLTSADELTTTPLGHRVSLGLALFWGSRLVYQFFGYSSELWRGKRFETAMHITFTALWIYFTAVFGFAARPLYA